VNYETVDDRFEDAQDALREYLIERDWKYSSNYPDSCWRWSKEIDGKHMVMDQSAAFDLQKRLDEDQELDAEDEG
jgi:hypothetical protein